MRVETTSRASTSRGRCVTGSASPPSAGILKTWAEPVRVETK